MSDPADAPPGLAHHFGSLELAILQVMWAGGESDVAQCLSRLGSDHAHETVKTVMERLVRKGLLERRKQSRAYVYWPTRGRREVEAELAAREARSLVRGFGDLAVVNFVREVRGDAGQVARLRALLDDIDDPAEDPGPVEDGAPR